MPERAGGHILLLDGDGPAIAEAADIVEDYRIGLAIVGDIAGHLAASRPFAAVVRESERGRHIRLVADGAELRTRLGKGWADCRTHGGREVDRMRGKCAPGRTFRGGGTGRLRTR